MMDWRRITGNRNVASKGEATDTQIIRVHGNRFAVPARYVLRDSTSEKGRSEVRLFATTDEACCHISVRAGRMKLLAEWDQVLQSCMQAPAKDAKCSDHVLAEKGLLGDKPYEYSIEKRIEYGWNGLGSSAVYYLLLEVQDGDSSLVVNGWLEESGKVGRRVNKLFATRCLELGDMESAKSGWTLESVDNPGIPSEVLNIADLVEYDEAFPESPLALAREFAQCVLS